MLNSPGTGEDCDGTALNDVECSAAVRIWLPTDLFHYSREGSIGQRYDDALNAGSVYRSFNQFGSKGGSAWVMRERWLCPAG